MESNHEQEELLEEFLLVEVLVKENPCGMPKSVMQSLKSVLKDIVGKHYCEGASREQVAKYFKKDVRTITRWKQEHEDFPEARHNGHKEVCYNWEEIIRWKLKHKELFH